MRKPRFIISAILISVLLSGCLTFEKKEYTFELNGSGGGTLTMKFYNIMSYSSKKDEAKSKANDDFDELIDKYIEGDELKNDFPAATITKKELFEEDGKLCGIVVVEFKQLSEVRLYQKDANSPFMYAICNSTLGNEKYTESNGEWGGDVMPVVFWDKKNKRLTLITNFDKPSDEYTSLLGKYLKWKK
ncbi:MAG: hypothetical protein PHD97_01275 [Bacteroidales bacterium]|nr:hypothetical protein [Bacteroidales bacterium]